MPRSSKAPTRGVSSTASRSVRKQPRFEPSVATITTPTSGRRLLPVKIAAQRLGLSVWGIRAMVYQSRIASHKIGSRLMVSEDEIDRIIAQSERPRVVA